MSGTTLPNYCEYTRTVNPEGTTCYVPAQIALKKSFEGAGVQHRHKIIAFLQATISKA